MIYALIVLYNKKVSESLTYITIKDQRDIKILIYDNSTKEYDNEKFCADNNIFYFTQHKNLGLSKAYNFAIDWLRQNVNDFLNSKIIILDDDTTLSESYKKEIKSITECFDYDVWLPIVKTDGFILSPSLLKYGGISKKIEDINNLDTDHLTAINSGMIINLKVFNKLKYNESLFLDCVDHDFMINIHKFGFKIKVMNCIINQSYSKDLKKVSLESSINRYQIYKKDFRIYCKECKCMWYFYLSMAKYTFKLTLRYKTLKFVKLY